MAFSFLISAVAASVSMLSSSALSIYKFDGRIDLQSEPLIEKSLKKGGTLEITTQGGDGRAIVRLAEFVLKNDIGISVKSYCFSDCASVLFPSSSRAELEPGAILGFHNTLTSMREIAKAHNFDSVASVFDPYSQIERRIYRVRGISQSWLIESHERILPTCFSFVSGVTRAENLIVLSKYTMFLPSDKTLKAAGYKYKGSLPKTEDEAMGDTLRVARERAKYYNWRFDFDGSYKTPTPNLDRLPRC